MRKSTIILIIGLGLVFFILGALAGVLMNQPANACEYPQESPTPTLEPSPSPEITIEPSVEPSPIQTTVAQDNPPGDEQDCQNSSNHCDGYYVPPVSPMPTNKPVLLTSPVPISTSQELKSFPVTGSFLGF